jgi:hypothetical protein
LDDSRVSTTNRDCQPQPVVEVKPKTRASFKMSEYRLTPEERETVITITDNSKTARIFTWQKRYQKQLQANPAARLIRQGTHKHPDDVFMELEVPRDLISICRRRVLSDERRAQLSERMRSRLSVA